MPNKKVPEFTELTTVADDDKLYIVDVSDVTDDATGTSFYALAKNVRGYPQTAAETTAGVTPTNFQYEPGNVLRYGTNTTPGTTDMTTAIQAALDSNDIVYVPSGIYLTSVELTITSGLTIFGDGYTSQIINNDIDDNVVDVTASNVKIHKLRITGGGKLLSLTDSFGYTIIVEGASHASPIEYVEISECFIENGVEGVRFNYCNYARVVNNYFDNTNAGWFQIRFWESDFGVASGNTCTGNDAMANAIGTWGASATAVKSQNCTISNNVCADFQFEAIEIGGNYNIISDNTIFSSGSDETSAGIYIRTTGTNDDTQGCVVSNNTIVGPRYGIYILEFENTGSHGPKNTIVSGNTFSSLKGHGILVRNNSTGTIIDGNTIDTVTTANTTGDGINVQTDDVTISNNYVKDCSLNGIKINGVRSDVSILNNRIENSTGDGIEINGACVRTRIIGNSVTNNSAWGIDNLIGVNSVIEMNVGTGNTSGFIRSVVPVLDNTGTPSIKGGSIFRTGGTTTITDLDDGYQGQEVTIFCEHAITFDTTGTSLNGSSVDITVADGDMIKFALDNDGSNWRLIAFVDASVDNSAGA